jgi:integrase
MARKVRLDKHVSRYVDRHGKERYRFRRKGRTVALPHPSHPDYKDSYAAALAGVSNDPQRIVPRSVEDLVRRYYQTPAWLQVSEVRRANLRSVIEPFREEHRDIPVSLFNFQHIEAILMERALPKVVDGRKAGGPHAAKRLRGQLVKLFTLAMKLGWVQTNPAELAERVKAKTKGYHTWTEAEVEQFRATHAVGTTARAAMEIMLWTFQRPGDGYLFGPQHLEGDKVRYTQKKTGKMLLIPAAEPMLDAIRALKMTGVDAFLLTEYGKPFSRHGFGNKFRKWCDAAGLPHCTAHGLRKAAATRLANHGATNQQLKAMGGWSNDKQVATYTAAADQERLAEAAMDLLSFQAK